MWYPSLIVKFKKELGILQYKSLRIAIKDWMRIFPREILDLLVRQKPGIIADYMTGSTLINCYNSGKPMRLYQMIKDNEYLISHTGKTHFFDSLSKKIGQQLICNGLDKIVQQFSDEWTNLRTKDVFRMFLVYSMMIMSPQ